MALVASHLTVPHGEYENKWCLALVLRTLIDSEEVEVFFIQLIRHDPSFFRS